MHRIICLFTFLTLSTSARADFQHHKCTAPANIKPILDDGACAGFIAHDAAGREVNRVATGYTISGTIYASADGRSVVMLHDYPTLEADFPKQDAIVVFRDGKRIARHAMADAIQRMDLVVESISHVRWIGDQPSSLVLGKRVRFETTSMRMLELDVATGKLTGDDTAMWKKCDLIAYRADIAKPVGGVYTMDPAFVAKGTLASSKLTFTADVNVQLVRQELGIGVCLVARGRSSWFAIDAFPAGWNAAKP